MPIIFIRSIPPNSGRFICFVLLSIVLFATVPTVGCALLITYVARWAGYLWVVASLAALVFVVARIDHKVVALLEWQIDQYSRPIWEKMEPFPEARTVFDRIAAYIVED
jgi:hypothetical protein